mgnify:FL=1
MYRCCWDQALGSGIWGQKPNSITPMRDPANVVANGRRAHGTITALRSQSTVTSSVCSSKSPSALCFPRRTCSRAFGGELASARVRCMGEGDQADEE